MSRGRKPVNPAKPKDTHISTRFSADLRDRLQKSADANGRSLSEEISQRLESSFSEPDRVVEAFGGETTAAFLRWFAITLSQLREATGQPWHRDPFTFRHAKEALISQLECMRPNGDQNTAPDDPPMADEAVRSGFARSKADARALILNMPLGKIAARNAWVQLTAVVAGRLTTWPHPWPKIARSLRPLVERSIEFKALLRELSKESGE